MSKLSLKPGELVPDVIDYSSIHALVVEKNCRISMISFSPCFLYVMPFAQWAIRTMINNVVMKVIKSQKEFIQKIMKDYGLSVLITLFFLFSSFLTLFY
jgi:hypothetical protein